MVLLRVFSISVEGWNFALAQPLSVDVNRDLRYMSVLLYVQRGVKGHHIWRVNL